MTEKITSRKSIISKQSYESESADDTISVYSPEQQSIEFLLAFASAYKVEKIEHDIICDFIIN